MLPDVQPNNRRTPFHQGIVLVGSAFDDQFAAVNAQPRPATAEASCGSFGELFFERIVATESAVDRFAQRTGWSTAAAATENRPKQRVIRMTTAVVLHCSLFCRPEQRRDLR